MFAACSQPLNGFNPRSIVVMVNAAIHHVDNVMQLINSVGALLWFLLPYSPDLNPIEEVFSEVKAYIQNNFVAYRNCADPHLIIYEAFASYIPHAGYKYSGHQSSFIINVCALNDQDRSCMIIHVGPTACSSD